MLQWMRESLRVARVSATLAAARSATALGNTLTMAHVRAGVGDPDALPEQAPRAEPQNADETQQRETVPPIRGAVFDFRSGLRGREALAERHCAPGSQSKWRLMSDADIGGKSFAQLAFRTRRKEDPVLQMLQKRRLRVRHQEQKEACPGDAPAGDKRQSRKKVVDETSAAHESVESEVEPDNDLGALVFSGILSLEKTGKMVRSGYAAIESPQFSPMLDLTSCDRLQMRVRSSGGLFVANIRTPSPIVGNLYQHPFSTPAGAWVTIELPFSGFLATVRGKIDPIQRPFDEDAIQNVGFLMAQRTTGPFRLEVQWIRAVNTNQHILESRYMADSFSADVLQAWRDELRGKV